MPRAYWVQGKVITTLAAAAAAVTNSHAVSPSRPCGARTAASVVSPRARGTQVPVRAASERFGKLVSSPKADALSPLSRVATTGEWTPGRLLAHEWLWVMEAWGESSPELLSAHTPVISRGARYAVIIVACAL